MIGLQSQHTQGAGPMKGNTRRSRRPRFGTAGAPLSWRCCPAGARLGGADAAAMEPGAEHRVDDSLGTPALPALPTTSSPKPAYRAPVAQAMPLADGFDVRLFEAMAQELVANQRVPGMAHGDRARRPRAQRARLRHHRHAGGAAGRCAHRVPAGVAVEVLRQHAHRHAGVRRRAALGQPRQRLPAGASACAIRTPRSGSPSPTCSAIASA